MTSLYFKSIFKYSNKDIPYHKLKLYIKNKMSNVFPYNFLSFNNTYNFTCRILRSFCIIALSGIAFPHSY